nr:MAG TPA: hypothetical protein [Caudoviricetes sp.]
MNDLEKLQELMMNNNEKMIEALKSTGKALRELLYKAQSTSNELYFGSLMVKGGVVQIPEDPTYNGDMISYNRPDIMITDTRPGFEIKWLHLKDNIYICDRGLINRVSWNTLKEAGYVDGKEVTIDGKRCLIRLMTGSDGSKGLYGKGCDNEWDLFMDKYDEDNELTHYKDMYTWCKEVDCDYSGSRSFRGYYSARNYYHFYAANTGAHVAFRPALEILNSEDEKDEK